MATVDVFRNTVEVCLTPSMSDQAVEDVDQDLEEGLPKWVSSPIWEPTKTAAEHVEDIRNRPDETANRTVLPIDGDGVPGGVEAVMQAYLREELSLSGDAYPLGTAEPGFYLELQLSVTEGVHSWDVLAIHQRH